ncbi:MAG: TlpA disulfide reductase family protein [Pedobacter sp.]
MKNILSKAILLVLFLGSNLNIYADCNITGNMTSFKGANFHINNNESALNEHHGELLDQGIIDKDGKFVSVFKVSKSGEAILYIGKTFFRIWIDNGELIISATDSGLSFSGSLAGENKFMFDSKFMQPYLIPNALAYKPNQISAYISKWNAFQNERLELIKEGKQNRLSERFIQRMEGEILNSTIYAKNQFPLLQSMIPEALPPDYYNFWSDFHILEDDPSQKAYMSALLDYAEFTVKKSYPLETSDRSLLIKKEIFFLDSVLSERPRTLEVIKGELTLFLIKYFDDKTLLEELRKNFKLDYPNSSYTKLSDTKWFEKEFRQNKKVSFTLKNISGQEVKIEEFLGKLVYVDFWGSWCKACLEEMPSAVKLRKKFEGTDIVFLYLDFYDSKSQWLNAVNVHRIDGVNLKAEDTDLPYFDAYFGVRQGFPRYALIDKKGILKTTSAPSPSDTSVIAFLGKALKDL